MAKVPDTTHNIQVIINDMKEQIDELASRKWKDKKIKLFVFGDYWFLCKLYGLSGPSGSYPCLWCHFNKHEMQNDDIEASKPRNLLSLRDDFLNFEREGSDRKKAKNHHNVVYSPLLNIEVNCVSPPYLHILSGLVLKHHKNLEEDVLDFDREISKEKSLILGVPYLFEKYGCNWEKAMSLKEHKQFLKTCVIMCDVVIDRKELKGFQKELHKLKEELHELKLSNKITGGPVSKALGTVLDQNNIVRQAFHGGNFIGNHCQRYLT